MSMTLSRTSYARTRSVSSFCVVDRVFMPAASLIDESKSIEASVNDLDHHHSHRAVSFETRRGSADRLLTDLRNRCLMHFLERIASKFNEAGVPLMALKGAALNLTVYRLPSERQMSDIDLMVKPEHVDEARALLQTLGCAPGEDHVQSDFFPRFYYETEYISQTIYPMRIDLHVRPFRPLRYSQLVPADAFWSRAEPVNIGRATVLIPSSEDMLIHLMVHAAIHGFSEKKWLEDIKRWIEDCRSARGAHRQTIDWCRFTSIVESWQLALPVRKAFARLDPDVGQVCPPWMTSCLSGLSVGWRDRMALWHAPLDGSHSVRHVFVNALTTPGLLYVLGYLRAVVFPDRRHMQDWSRERNWRWVTGAYLLRWLWPVVKYVPRCLSGNQEQKGKTRAGLARNFANGAKFQNARMVVTN